MSARNIGVFKYSFFGKTSQKDGCFIGLFRQIYSIINIVSQVDKWLASGHCDRQRPWAGLDYN